MIHALLTLVPLAARWMADTAGTAASDPWAARIAACAAVLTALGVLATNVVAKRNLGRKNGRGDMFQMLHDLQDEMRLHREEQAERANLLDRRLTRQEEQIDRRLTSLRALISGVSGRVDDLEHPDPTEAP